MPRKIIVTQYMTLDGVIEDPVGMENSGLGNWTGPFTRGPDGDVFKLDELVAADSLIFGRTTYDGFAAVWPNIKDQAGYADRMNALPKVVASTTLQDPTWQNTIVWSGDLVEAATAFKADGDGETLIFGSISIVHQLAQAGLIDEYRVMVYPILVGAGKRLFPDGLVGQLSLIESKQLGDGIMLLRYVTN
jgi:dihydrofolate reductase